MIVFECECIVTASGFSNKKTHRNTLTTIEHFTARTPPPITTQQFLIWNWLKLFIQNLGLPFRSGKCSIDLKHKTNTHYRNRLRTKKLNTRTTTERKTWSKPNKFRLVRFWQAHTFYRCFLLKWIHVCCTPCAHYAARYVRQI